MDSCEFKGRTFVFKEPTPANGCAILNMITAYRVPFIPENFFGLSLSKEVMPPEALDKYLKLCLQNVYEDLGKVKAPVIDAEGQCGIIDPTGPMFTMIVSQYAIFFGEYWRRESD